ncbi:opa1 mitochondrial dynamin like GTPase isoform X2 [Lycorma delicatula]|uniref:opa1 mitochondrial dynamin like GTPase isoform X2 n=1 Tax=Lycorma delicatula TaxID=130591 RepID=UPI003F51403F
MHRTIRGKFGWAMVGRTKPGISLLAIIKCKHGQLHFSSWTQKPPKQRLLVVRPLALPYQNIQRRGVAMLIAKVLKGALKVRYVVLGSLVGGGYSMQKSIQEWKDSLPDMSWLDDLKPSNEKIDAFRGSLISMKEKFKDFDIDPRLKEFGENKYNNMKEWFDKRMDEAILATEASKKNSESTGHYEDAFKSVFKKLLSGKLDTHLSAMSAASFDGAGESNEKERVKKAEERVKELQERLLDTQQSYQKELTKLERENKQLRQQLLIRRDRFESKKEVQKSLIDMYSEVLDELSGYDSSYQTQDHLPRVVVVGDQSAGKTSVLEMIAQARIFPRGAGEMMTRAPVKVTLSEGPYHIAQFRDSDQEYDLTKEKDLEELRNQVEYRMTKSVSRSGKTVSNDVISMTVKGPGIHRMVLVDLPGIISTVTRDMSSDTGESIKKMSQLYMSNPNAIILCIQDGSVDAERSNVTELVSKMDPQGKRTIFVLTKVDMAEDNLANPERIKKILSGSLFPMKALGYFAVVTGRGRKNDSIQDIQEYEENFFRNSKLFQNVSVTGQVTTRNLSRAVADCFWKMVKETVEQQADAFKATRFNLETEWKNNFPRLRELDRDELFEKARGEILDEVVNLSGVSVKQWEELLMKQIWEKVSQHVFENIYIPSAQTEDSKMFNTSVDIKLREWANQTLPQQSVEAGWEVLRDEFTQFIERGKQDRNYDDIFDLLKNAVMEDAMNRHVWESKANEVLRVIQLNTLEDRSVKEKQQWDSAVKFLENSIKDKLKVADEEIRKMVGPGAKERWIYWKYATEDQNRRSTVKSELDKILYTDHKHPNFLNPDEVTTVRNNLQRNGLNVENEYILEVWNVIYRRHFLNRSLARAFECRKSYYLYHTGLDVECSDVVLFWRIEQMMKVTANALRQQVMNREAQRLDKEIEEVLDDYSRDPEKKFMLLTGKRVELAEELKKVKRIQEKLEEFIQALNKEKNER